MASRPVVARVIQRLFNNGGYWAKVQSGELKAEIKNNRHRKPDVANADLPFCTHSQIIAYVDQNGKKVAVVHQYLLPDSTIGGCGKPDPKLLVHDGIRYTLKMR